MKGASNITWVTGHTSLMYFLSTSLLLYWNNSIEIEQIPSTSRDKSIKKELAKWKLFFSMHEEKFWWISEDQISSSFNNWIINDYIM